MHEPPPPQLIALLGQLGLATPGQIRKAEKYVRRLARDLPQFESVWIDALAQARLLSPFQAARLNAGRGELLRVGPYLLCQPLADCPWIRCYRARHVASGQTVRLAVAEVGRRGRRQGLPRLEALVAAADRMPTEHLLPIRHAGSRRRPALGRLAVDRRPHGRDSGWFTRAAFPPEMVLEIARAMTAGLAALEEDRPLPRRRGDAIPAADRPRRRDAASARACGRISAGGRLCRTPTCRPRLMIIWPRSGSRPARRRTSPATCMPAVACGGICFAAGRRWPAARAWRSCGPPMRAAIVDVRRLAPDVPAALAETIAACVRREPQPSDRSRWPSWPTCSAGPRRPPGSRWLAKSAGRSPHVSAATAIVRRRPSRPPRTRSGWPSPRWP